MLYNMCDALVVVTSDPCACIILCVPDAGQCWHGELPDGEWGPAGEVPQQLTGACQSTGGQQGTCTCMYIIIHMSTTH